MRARATDVRWLRFRLAAHCGTSSDTRVCWSGRLHPDLLWCGRTLRNSARVGATEPARNNVTLSGTRGEHASRHNGPGRPPGAHQRCSETPCTPTRAMARPCRCLIMHGGCHTLRRSHAAASSRARGARRQDFFETSTGSFMKVYQRLASSMGSQACASHSMKQIMRLWQQ